MNRQTEDRLRAAFDAKAEQVTDERLDRLAARAAAGCSSTDVTTRTAPRPPRDSRLLPDGEPVDTGRDAVTRLDVDHPAGSPGTPAGSLRCWPPPRSSRSPSESPPSRPRDHGKRAPTPPATQVNAHRRRASTPSARPPPPPRQPSATARPTVVAPPYLPRGQQGSRSQVPWSAVGPAGGWCCLSRCRLVGLAVPLQPGRRPVPDQRPVAAGASLLAWSPDAPGDGEGRRLPGGDLAVRAAVDRFHSPGGFLHRLHPAEGAGRPSPGHRGRHCPAAPLQRHRPAPVQLPG